MGDLAEVILPVFVVIAMGGAVVWRGWFSDAGVDALMVFTQKFAIPLLLFRGMAGLDLRMGFDLALLGSFYGGAIAGFAAGMLGARLIFGRPWTDSVAIGFIALFSNSLMLGLPITERAFGTGALTGNYAIIALHTPICYGIGITAMEIARAGGRGLGLGGLGLRVGRTMLGNTLILGIAAGLAVNLTGLPLPAVVLEGVDMVIRAALPAALFGLGGILYRYRPEGDFRLIAWVVAASLILHPAVTWSLGQASALNEAGLRSAVVTAAMAPGVNAYIFANMYGVGRRVAASAVLMGTGLVMGTAVFWLHLVA